VFRDTQTRSIIKALSWRVTGTLDTVILSLIITGSASLAISIGITEVFTKLILYYIHERIWNLFQWGRHQKKPTHRRSLAKSVSWRITGTIDTIVIAFLYSNQVESAFSIGVAELFTKIFFFYIHERIWAWIKWGRIWEEIEVK